MANNKPSSSYDAFNSVDKLVSKPVMGSDGAALWQDFRQKNRRHISSAKVAPKAPLKAVDRASGLGSWEDERQHEARIRQESGDAPLHAGYTNFADKHSAEDAIQRKQNKRILERKRPDDTPYFLPSSTFEGWKMDYIFTTKDRGTGYYWDGMDSVKKLRGEPLPTEKRDDEPPDDAPNDDVSAKEPPKKKKKKKKELPVIVNDPNNPMEQVAAALQRRQLQQQVDTTTKDLAPGWEAAVDPSSKKTYYFERQTGQRSWTKPTPLPPGWSSAKDPSSGKEYFYHATTGETKWERP